MIPERGSIDLRKEVTFQTSQLCFSEELEPIAQNLGHLKIDKLHPKQNQATLNHLSEKVIKTIKLLENNDQRAIFTFNGPEWCRQNPEEAAQDHAKVIIDTYGKTYALPNKDPNSNLEALKNGTDMYLTYKNGKPVGTACLVPVKNGVAELGRAASQGNVGNRIIQDMRIIDWLTNKTTSRKYHSIFATCRTAPDRDIGETTPMRGGQAVSHMWGEIPNLLVAGFGPLYKKHSKLETFAYSILTRESVSLPAKVWITDPVDASFVSEWAKNYKLSNPSIVNFDQSRNNHLQFEIEYPPKESGVTEYVHGEIITTRNNGTNLKEAFDTLKTTGVPFIQIAVPIDRNTLDTQKQLRDLGFKSFMITPSIGNEPAKLWFGTPVNTKVVPRYWDINGQTNPFWERSLEVHGKRISSSW